MDFNSATDISIKNLKKEDARQTKMPGIQSTTNFIMNSSLYS